MESLKSQRTIIKRSLTRFVNSLNIEYTAAEILTLKVKLERNHLLFDQFNKVQSEIDLLCSNETEFAAQEVEREQFENTYDVAIAKARGIINSFEEPGRAVETVASLSSSSELLDDSTSGSNFLPKISMPKFDGNYSEWVKFRDTFESIIHNNNKLSKIQKFTYLNNALVGRAANVIASLGLSGDNYIPAWQRIKERFEEENGLIEHHLSGMFNAPTLARNSSDDLQQLIDTFYNHLAALKALNEPTEHWDTVMCYWLISKLNASVRSEWAKERANQTGKIKWTALLKFLEDHCKYLSMVNKHNNSNSNSITPTNLSKKHSVKNRQKSFVISEKSCPLCKGAHALYACDDFKTLSCKDRSSKVYELKVCFNCLQRGHHNRACTYGPCKRCGRKHNVLIHIDQVSSTPQPLTITTPQNERASTSTTDQKAVGYNVRYANQCSEYVLLGTAIVYLYDQLGNIHECRALLDSCSQPHILSQALCNRLGFVMKKGTTTLSGIEHGEAKVHGKVTVKIKSRVTQFKTTITCLVLDKIDNEIPSPRVQAAGIQIPPGLDLADPDFDQARPVDLLIGAGLFYELLCVGQIKPKADQPTFQKTLLGWIAVGNMMLPSPTGNVQVKCNLIRNRDLLDKLESFWSIENCFQNSSSKQLVMDVAERHFQKTIKRDDSGRFIASIPFEREKLINLGESKQIAYKRFVAMERKLSKNPQLYEQYSQFMEEYEKLGHMCEVRALELDDKPHFYLPHHAVIKEQSTTTKLRVVFDGSAKSSTGLSLNDIQYTGTPVQDDLFSIILRFRQHSIVISADIAKMYRQVLIKEEERSMQRILWRTDGGSQVKIFQLNTVTYGTASAPFLATRCLYELGISCQVQYPAASHSIIHDFYVDDLLTGADSVEAARKLRNELKEILGSAGFELRKWASNDLRALDNSNLMNGTVLLQGDKDPKTLGLLWNSRCDTLKYHVNRTEVRRLTKRIVLSIIAQIYDPLGLVGPAIIPAKVIMQRLWSLELDWDESLPQELHLAWETIHNELMLLNEITIDRHVLELDRTHTEYHGFCDASEKAYGACIYVTSILSNGSRTSRLLCAKSRVAPLKATTIPRLELLGALLLAQLAHKVSAVCSVPPEKWYYWSDSMITLAWIKSPSRRWKTFVANRVAEIQELTNTERWVHVESERNPADFISRGLTATELKNSDLWWYGPTWLASSRDSWPKMNSNGLQDISEERSRVLIARELNPDKGNVGQRNQPLRQIFNIFERFSTLVRLIRVTAYILRFVNNCRRTASHQERCTNQLQTDEIASATLRLVQCAQVEDFSSEIASLTKNQTLPKNSKLSQLNPFLDQSGLLRVGGRLENASISFDQKHPMILASNHKLTHLIIEHEHDRLLHTGCNAVISSLRQRYWPLNCKNTVKGILRKCIVCFKVRPIGTKYLMGNLPSARVTPMRAFYNCGVDFSGHFFIKELGRIRTSIKAYMCIFVCLSTKAVHIELARDLSTEAFLNCMKRFTSRRGLCKNMYSDNGTNFVGADRDLKTFLNDSHFKNEIVDFCTTRQINWHFMPPSAPHFGGLWESAVKSAKYHLKRVVGETRLTYEELYTVLSQVEACMNSRPLSPLSNDPEDLTPLTPGHFLVGDSLTAFPQEDIRNVCDNRLNRFQLIQKMLQHFWQRWHREYLPQLQGRQKWTESAPNILKPGLMVLIKEDNVPPLQWALGRITELHPGADAVTRVVSIRVSKGIIKRPVSKICILPMNE